MRNSRNISCVDVANYFLTLTNDESGDLMSLLKLQKLVYYAQGLHLAIYDKPLFGEVIIAHETGPVCPALCEKFKESIQIVE